MKLDIVETKLEAGVQQSVHSLFTRTDFKAFERIIESKAKKAATEATNKALESNKFEKYAESADSELALAIRYKTALEVIEELKTQKDEFTTVTLK